MNPQEEMTQQAAECFLFLIFYFVLEHSRLANSVVTVSGEQQRDSIGIHVSILPSPLPFRLPNTEQSSMCYAIWPYWLSILNIAMGAWPSLTPWLFLAHIFPASDHKSILQVCEAFLIVQLVKNPPAMQKTRFNSWVEKIHWRRDRLPTPIFLGFPGGSVGKESACDVGDLGSIPGLERSPHEEKGYPFQDSGLVNSIQSMGLQRVRHDWRAFTFQVCEHVSGL